VLTLAVETSVARYGLALGGDGGVAFDSLRDLGEAAGRDLGDLLQQGLSRLGAAATDISAVCVDIGPGSLGSLRDGVAFANGFAYARGIPVFAFTSFELLGVEAGATAARPALIARRANEGLAYAGVFDGARVRVMRHGRLDDVVRAVTGDGRTFVAAGGLREQMRALLAHADVAVTDRETPAAATMLAVGIAGRTPSHPLTSPVLPLHEGSGVFRD
jgi:tRNA threonylcarbamoyl adenosine modification protein YeaZ